MSNNLIHILKSFPLKSLAHINSTVWNFAQKFKSLVTCWTDSIANLKIAQGIFHINLTTTCIKDLLLIPYVKQTNNKSFLKCKVCGTQHTTFSSSKEPLLLFNVVIILIYLPICFSFSNLYPLIKENKSVLLNNFRSYDIFKISHLD